MFTQSEQCLNWQFTDIPAFKNGRLSPLFASCGQGLLPKGSCFLHTFFDVEQGSVETYAERLMNQGYSLLYQHKIGGNLYYQFALKNAYFYISYLKNSAVARFVWEDCTVPLKDISSGCQKQIYDNTVFSQFSLHYDDMNRYTTCDCGMNYVYRLRDNRLILIDGGEQEQCTEAAFSEYLDFLRSLTGTKAGEPITVALWLCTHAHNDHCDFFHKLLLRCHDEIRLEAVAFNFPDESNTPHSESVMPLRRLIADCYPGVKYCKLHGGMHFSVANATVTVLTSVENSLGIREDKPFPGLNDSSTVFTMEAEGITTLFLADMGDINAEVFLRDYADSFNQVDFLQAAHHGINAIYDVYEAIETKKLLLPQCSKNMITRFQDKQAHYEARYGASNILLANDRTDIFTMKNGTPVHTSRPHVGEPFDGSEW